MSESEKIPAVATAIHGCHGGLIIHVEDYPRSIYIGLGEFKDLTGGYDTTPGKIYLRRRHIRRLEGKPLPKDFTTY